MVGVAKIKTYNHPINSVNIWRWKKDPKNDKFEDYDMGLYVYIEGRCSNYTQKFDAKVSLRLNINDMDKLIKVLTQARDEMKKEIDWPSDK